MPDQVRLMLISVLDCRVTSGGDFMWIPTQMGDILSKIFITAVYSHYFSIIINSIAVSITAF